MAGVKRKGGGKHPGAGRPYKIEGCITKVMRVPSYMKLRIETLIRVQAEWISENEEKKPVGYLDEAEEKKRKDWKVSSAMRRSGWRKPESRQGNRKRIEGK